MRFSRLGPKDVLIDDDALSEYESKRAVFYNELVNLNTNIYIAEKIFDFPFDVFIGNWPTFFRLVIDNFLNISVLIVTRLATDTDPDFYTLVQFKNRVLKLLKPEHQEAFRALLKQTRFDRETRDLLEKARNLRHGRIAHLKEDFDAESTIRSLSELQTLRDRLNSLYDTLSFNVGSLFVPLEYYEDAWHPRGDKDQSDIEKLLDCVARDSYVLNMPEQNPEMWRFARQELGMCQAF
jgi:hypothetical protein